MILETVTVCYNHLGLQLPVVFIIIRGQSANYFQSQLITDCVCKILKVKHIHQHVPKDQGNVLK